MEKKNLLRSLLVGSLLIVISCTQEAGTSVINKEYQSYSNDGLSLRHPAKWSLAYDETDALYADRDLSFDISEFSSVSVLVYNKSTVDEYSVANNFSRKLKLNTSKNIDNHKQISIEKSGFKGLRLSWENTLMDPVSVEMTILKISDSPKSVFAVFNLLDEDIDKESLHIIPVINSISIH